MRSLISPSLCPSPPLSLSNKPHQFQHVASPQSFPKFSLHAVSTESLSAVTESKTKPSPAEVSRSIMDLAQTGTLSALAHDTWPLGIGARFVVDPEGAPALCFNPAHRSLAVDNRSSFHVKFEQSGLRTPQCTLLGSLTKPTDEKLLKKLSAKWEKKFGEEADLDLMYLISVERIFHMEDFSEDGIWVAPSEYVIAVPDPLRNVSEKIVEEMNSRHAEDVNRLCNVYVDTGFQASSVSSAKMIWVDRLGFDLYIYSENGVFVVRIPFPREVTDEKAVKSSFNSMSHLAWEIEKNYAVPDFERVSSFRKIR
ncbi:glutamyl-tRNA reductase-binding protein [Carex littledalei]|uniref:Glutamyl-tRNA reductase-binding protein n=1 Tax=Carex littledalei TaxID=544730 RepID=A0A833QIE7_9POAL|nr:glutamyl-tRNA reductase-binding protein [Carex littledalei]